MLLTLFITYIKSVMKNSKCRTNMAEKFTKINHICLEGVVWDFLGFLKRNLIVKRYYYKNHEYFITNGDI